MAIFMLYRQMKIKHIIGLALIFIFCSAERCNRSNDLLSRMYQRAHKSYSPLTTKKEPIYTPLVGSWLLGNERYLVIGKEDAQTYQFKFLSNQLDGNDIIYNGYITTIAGKKFLNMLGYESNYMFFKVGKDSEGSMSMLMISNDHDEKVRTAGGLFNYLQKNANLSDTSSLWYEISLEKLSNEELEKQLMEKFRYQVREVSDYELYAKRFPKDPTLPEMREKAIKYSIDASHSVKDMMYTADKYPEIKPYALIKAKKKCTNTDWCIEYVDYFPNDPAKDSIIEVAFREAETKNDYNDLLKAFPNHPKAAGLDFKIANEEYKRVISGYFNKYDEERMQRDYATRPDILNYFNTMRMMGNISMDEGSFVSKSYILTQKGMSTIDQFMQLVKLMNQKTKVVNDIYLVVESNYSFNLATEDLINFRLSANRCIAVKQFIQSRYGNTVNVHLIPNGKNKLADPLIKEKAKFFIADNQVEKEKSKFYSACYDLKQTVIIPDASREMMNTEYVRDEELEFYLLGALANEIKLYKSKQEYSKVIPENHWDSKYEKIQPGFHEFKEKILATAIVGKIENKQIPLFVIKSE